MNRLRTRARTIPAPDNKTQLLVMLRSLYGTNKVVQEYVFHPSRKWRFDYAIPDLKIAVEYQGHGKMAGGSGHSGGHASVSGLANDAEKFNEAHRLGWRVLLFTSLHFREADRAKHKLTNPYETLRSFSAA